MQRSTRWRAGILAAALVAAEALTPPALAQEVPPPQSFTWTNEDVGFAESIYQKVDPAPRLQREDEYVGDKKPTIRVDLDWYWLEQTSCEGPCTDRLDWRGIDKTVNAAHKLGIRVLLILDYSPSWANGGHTGGFFPTREHDRDWVDIVSAAVTHFGDKVQAYEIWNEPNQKEFGDFDWPGTDAEKVGERKKRYWELVKLAHPVIDARCPQCVVLAGGSANGQPTGKESSASSWLQAGYDAGARAYFDAVTHHPYYPIEGPTAARCGKTWENPFGPLHQMSNGEWCGELAAVRDVMVKNGDGEKKIWGTEWGKATAEDGPRPHSLEDMRNLAVDGVYTWRSVDYTGPLFLYTYQEPAREEGCAIPVSSGCFVGVETNEPGVPPRPKSPLFEDLSAALQGHWQDRLLRNQVLTEDSALRSPDGRFWLWMQQDGNLVLYRAATATTGQEVLWHISDLRGSRLVNQSDGALQLMNRNNVSVWNSSTYQGLDRPGTLVLQNDGNLVLYRDSDGKALWESRTCCQ